MSGLKYWAIASCWLSSFLKQKQVSEYASLLLYWNRFSRDTLKSKSIYKLSTQGTWGIRCENKFDMSVVQLISDNVTLRRCCLGSSLCFSLGAPRSCHGPAGVAGLQIDQTEEQRLSMCFLSPFGGDYWLLCATHRASTRTSKDRAQSTSRYQIADRRSKCFAEHMLSRGIFPSRRWASIK